MYDVKAKKHTKTSALPEKRSSNLPTKEVPKNEKNKAKTWRSLVGPRPGMTSLCHLKSPPTGKMMSIEWTLENTVFG